MTWRYIRQVNSFFRIEEPREGKGRDGEPLGPNVICFVQTEAEARMICYAVNSSSLQVGMFKPGGIHGPQKEQKAEAKGSSLNVG